MGATSGVGTAGDRDGARAPFTVALVDRRIILLPATDAPAVAGAAMYSMLGERVAAPQSAPATGEPIRFDAGGLACGAYVVVVHTAHGTLSYPVILAR
jgi:hypothetical protein